MSAPWVLGVDSGGSGLRTALAAAGASGTPEPVGRRVSEVPVRTGPAGIDPEHLLEVLLPSARLLLERAGGGRVAAVCVGAAGMATLGEALREHLPTALAETLGVRSLALAADGVAAYAGALGATRGAIVAAGTGMIALGTDLRAWRRADGWGHLLGDCGGGAWIGRAGLEAAMRAHDGRAGGSPALLSRAERLFGSVPGLPGQLYPRTDRPAVLASFAPEVAACAADASYSAEGVRDPVPAGILRDAAVEIARSAAAVCPPPGSGDTADFGTTASASIPEVSLTGGLFRMGQPLLDPVHAELAARLPHARVVTATGDPLDGALHIAAQMATVGLGLPRDARLLTVH
ncbi:N-acetylglucosamine kinase [Streptomyces oceani]|uniref:N-acetylglucosamine kinase n=1 Tax=Streptomyces oceani TaxID=1075402 RepID=UPI000A7AA212